jgi:hypothetical protein
MSNVNLTLQNNVSLAGCSFNASVALAGNYQAGANISQPAAQPGTVTTHTSNSDVVLTMTNSSHGIINGARCDLYWSGGYRRGMTAGNVSGTSVELTGGSGTNAPVATTAINVGICTIVSFGFINANLVALFEQCLWESVFDMLESDGATETLSQHIVPAVNGQQAGSGYQWYSAYGANPTTGTATYEISLSHANPAAAVNMQAAYITT